MKKKYLFLKHSARSLIACYVVLVAVALGSVLKAIFFPIWPHTPALSSQSIREALEAADYSPVPSKSLPEYRSYDLATSPIVSYSLANGYTLRIFSAMTRDRESFKIQNLVKNHKGVRLEDSRPLAKSPVPTLAGLITQRTALQTCQFLSPNSVASYAVDQFQLTLLIDSYDTANADRFRQIIGIQPTRTYRCTLITLLSPDQSPIPMKVWSHLLSAVSPALLP